MPHRAFALVAIAATLGPTLPAQELAKLAPVLLGRGAHRYRWVEGWGRLPDGKVLGNTHGCTIVGPRGNIWFNTDTERAVLVLSPAGKWIRSWGKDFRGGLHGMTLVREGDESFLYLAHTARHEVIKTTLTGKVLWRLGYPKECGHYEKATQYRPTSVARAPDGSIFVADGYGKSWVHKFDKDRKWLFSFGGPGKKPGKMHTPHGLWIDTRGEEPVLIVCDRENHRLQIFDLDGKLQRIVHGMLRRPCNVYPDGKELVVADLAGRITILDQHYELVLHLGDNPDPKKRAKNGVPKTQWKPGEFISPHSVCVDADGSIYVMDWLRLGRVSKLQRIH